MQSLNGILTRRQNQNTSHFKATLILQTRYLSLISSLGSKIWFSNRDGVNELEWLSLSDWTAEGAKNFPHIRKSLATLAENSSEGLSAPTVDVPPRIKFKRLDKTARHMMQVLDDKKKVRRAKFYYSRDRMNSLKKR